MQSCREPISERCRRNGPGSPCMGFAEADLRALPLPNGGSNVRAVQNSSHHICGSATLLPLGRPEWKSRLDWRAVAMSGCRIGYDTP